MKWDRGEAESAEDDGEPLGVVDCASEDDHGRRGELVGEVQEVGVFVLEREEEVVLK
jgi:hypothetical protein